MDEYVRGARAFLPYNLGYYTFIKRCLLQKEHFVSAFQQQKVHRVTWCFAALSDLNSDPMTKRWTKDEIIFFRCDTLTSLASKWYHESHQAMQRWR